ncbi:hypothetical protein [Streptomyces geranii]|uniref:hypothetical protein n=1 Tax=Streptomyces geranii TaxID=2058923 RepID=UPI0013009797|nr:hypothetical protein [Streptomyces geranii]
MIQEAQRAAGHRLPQQAQPSKPVAPCGLPPEQLTTAERLSRMCTDLARAWRQLGKPEQAVTEPPAADGEGFAWLVLFGTARRGGAGAGLHLP